MKFCLPDSAQDLLVKDGKLLMRSLTVYEVLIRFGHIIRLTPFRFEDFSAALLATDEQSPLLAEIHIQLLRSLYREDRQQQTWLGPPDLRDSINIYLLLADQVTWPAALKLYLSADRQANAHIIDLLDKSQNNYPFDVDVQDRLHVLEQLCDQFLLSTMAREDIVNGTGPSQRDTSCRVCSKSVAEATLVTCRKCPSIHHLKCCDPPLEQVPLPEDLYICSLCKSNQVTGVTDCMQDDDQILRRIEAVGMDKLGRRYWFLVRRLFIIDEHEEDVRYYTNSEQLDQILDGLKAARQEQAIVECLKLNFDEIKRQMKITETLYTTLMTAHKNSDGSYSKYLGQDGLHKSYANLYSTTSSGTCKNQHSDREIIRSLGNKFSMNSLNSFKWPGSLATGSLASLTISVKSSILKLEATIPQTFVHPCWQSQRQAWVRSINNGKGPKDYASALSLLETGIRSVLFKSTWFEGVGFSQLFRLTLLEREELKKTDRQPRGFERREWFSQDFELSYRLGTMVKFSQKLKPVKHQIWKQKGEEYRLTGLNGWFWRSSTHTSRLQPKPKLARIDRWKWLSPMNNHPFVVDMINEIIKSTDVIDVAANLSANEDQRLLYPRKPILNAFKQKRVSKLEGLLKRKLELDRQRVNLKTSSDPVLPIQIKSENGVATSKLATTNNSNCNDKSQPDTKVNPISNIQTEKNATNNSSNVNTPVTSTTNSSQPQQQVIKRCILPKPKLPPCHDFMTKRSKKCSLLVLPDSEIHKLARTGGLIETKSFIYTAKQNAHIWPYGMTPRPTFRTCWLYKNRVLKSIQDLALQLKVIYACIRWDELQARPPPSGHNVIVTDEESITIELLKKRDKLPYMTHSEYLIKKVKTPIEQPTKYRKVVTKKATPSARSGLRERRHVETQEEKGPITEEIWVSENQLELWELKQFDEKIERQNQLIRERALKEEAERRRKLEEERRRKVELERRRKAEEEAKKAKLTQINLKQSPSSVASPSNSNANNLNSSQQRPSPATPVLRYFRTDQGQIIRLPASYLQRGTPLILRHVGPGPNQTSTYIIRPQVTVKTPTATNSPVVTTTPSVTNTPVGANTPVQAGTLITTSALVVASTPVQVSSQVPGSAPVVASPTVQSVTPVVPSTPVQASSQVPSSTPVVANPPVQSSTPVEVSTSVQANSQVPSSTPVVANPPVQSSTPVEVSTSVQANSQAPSSAPVVASPPVQSGTPVEASTPVQTSTPVEASTPVQASTPVEENTPVQASTLITTSATVGASTPSQTSTLIPSSAPVEASTLVQASTPALASPPILSSAPVVTSSQPVTSNPIVTSEMTTDSDLILVKQESAPIPPTASQDPTS